MARYFVLSCHLRPSHLRKTFQHSSEKVGQALATAPLCEQDSYSPQLSTARTIPQLSKTLQPAHLNKTLAPMSTLLAFLKK